jgi:hypothetical protein
MSKESSLDNDNDKNNNSSLVTRKLLVHWRGEKDAGYSKPFRQLEFQGALAAESVNEENHVSFVNALQYTGDEFMPDVNMEHFNEAMQYLSFDGSTTDGRFSRGAIIRAASRCSLVHAVYEVVAESDHLNHLAELAIADGGFADLYQEHAGDDLTWCFRARSYLGDATTVETVEATKTGKVKRYSSSSRSMGLEKKGLKALTPLLLKLGGKVDLLHPQVKIYIFDGLQDGEGHSRKVLARRIATGPKVRLMTSVGDEETNRSVV